MVEFVSISSFFGGSFGVDLGDMVPLLAGISRVDLARLLGDLSVVDIPPGTTYQESDLSQLWLYFILSGEVLVEAPDGDEDLSILALGPGEMIGETALASAEFTPLRIRAVTAVQLGRLPLSRFQRLMESDPSLAHRFIHLLAVRTGTALDELARLKRVLAVYERELWDQLAPSSPAVASVQQSKPVQKEVCLTRRQRLHAAKIRERLRPTSAVALPVLVGFLAHQAFGGEPEQAIAAGILGGAAGFWLLGTFPDYVTAMAAALITVTAGLAPAKIVLSGFATPSWFLLLGVLGIGVAVNRSGLVYRSALHMMRLLPPSYRGQSLALALTGLLLTPLLPSSNSRVALVSPLAKELSEAMRFAPHSRGSAGLAMAGFLGFGQLYFLFFSGANICMLAWSLLPDYFRREIDWIWWLVVALPLGLIIFLTGYGSILLLFPGEKGPRISKQTIAAQLRVLGPLTRAERVTAGVLGGVLLGFFTQPWHEIDPGWVALGGFLLLVVLGVIDREGLKGIDWAFLLLVGTLVGLFEVTRVTGLSSVLSDWVGRLLLPLGTSPYLFLGGVAILTIVIRLAIPLQQAVLLMVLALTPIALQTGYNPFVVALVVLAMSNSWILPQQNTMYLTAHAGTDEQCFTHKQVRPLAMLHAAFGVLAVLASVPYWNLLGLLPR